MGRRINEQPQTVSKSVKAEQTVEDSIANVIIQRTDASRMVVLHGDVNELLISNIIVQLLQLANQNHKPIHMVISTYGGSVDEMFSLYDTIKFLPCPVHTVALGKVMSAGVLLLASGQKGMRMIGRSARIMMHPISGGMYGNVFENINESKEFKRLQDLMVNALQRETKMTKLDIEKIMTSGHDFYLTPDDAIKMGIVDKIIGDTKG
jgi:ATP-dependent Clp protease protease subunit